MKLFTKISLIIAAVSLGLGVLGVCLGMAMGADVRELSEMGIYISPYHQVRVSGVITEVEDENREEVNDIRDDVFEERFYIYEDKISEHKEDVNEHNHHLGKGNTYHSYNTVSEDIQRLEVDVQNAEIYIFTTEEEKIRFDSNRQKEIGRVNGKTLKLKEDTFFDETLVLEIYIPEDLLREIDIKAAAGSVYADELTADNVSIEVDAAAVQIDELKVTREAELQVDAGKMVIGYYDGPQLDVECALGSVLVVCEGNKDDYNYQMECGMGKIVFDQESYSGVGEKINLKNGGHKLIDVECGMGEIMLEFPNSL